MILIINSAVFPVVVAAQSFHPLQLDATAAILVEQTTGRVLYAYNAHERRYPASMSKMITALVVMEYLEIDDVVTVGVEINAMPPGYATNIHAVGETISVHMLLKALMIRSGNETGRTLALEVVRRTTGNSDITYNQAKPMFSNMMNAKARSLGVQDTNFNNPYGLHAAQHFTTAYDLALVARAFMDNPVLAEIVGIHTFEGDSLGGIYYPDGNVREYSWTNTNRLLPGADFGHPHMQGIKTGFTTPAGHCFAGAAYHNGLGLVTIVFDSPDPGRWQDTRRLMDFGFANFSFREIAWAEQVLETIYIENPRRGDPDTLEILSTAGYRSLLSHAEYEAVTRVITYDPLLVAIDYEAENEKIRLFAPLEAGEVVGMVEYIVNGEVIFYAPIAAARDVYERTFDSDMDYYIALFFDNIFTTRALPYWFGAIGTIFGIFGMSMAITVSRRARKFERWQPTERRRVSRYDRR